MKTFIATRVDDKSIELANSKDLEDLFNCIDKDESFILQWYEGTTKLSKVIIGNNYSSKVKNGDVTLSAKEGKK